MNKRLLLYSGISIALVLFFLGNVFIGSVRIPADKVLDILVGNEVERTAWTNIIVQSRIPQAITALLAGAALAVSGLMLQTLFQNPLAGPSILGISDGANFGVALVMLSLGGTVGGGAYSLSGSLAVVVAALVGAMTVLILIVYFSGKLKNNVMVLILGMMIGYLASSGIALLNYMSSADGVRSFVMWGMGSFSNVSLMQMPFYLGFLLVPLFLSVLLIKPLNALLLGDRYAANLGVSVKKARVLILLCTGLLTATVTAFCGPVSFIGLAVPHIARLMLGTSNHKTLIPFTLLTGAGVALVCNLLTVLPFGTGVLPLNAITPLLGAPVIIYVIVNRKNIQYFN